MPCTMSVCIDLLMVLTDKLSNTVSRPEQVARELIEMSQIKIALGIYRASCKTMLAPLTM